MNYSGYLTVVKIDEGLKSSVEIFSIDEIRYKISEKIIDELNIKNATYSAMHKVIKELDLDFENSILIIDGNDFKPYIYFDKLNNSLKNIRGYL